MSVDAPNVVPCALARDVGSRLQPHLLGVVVRVFEIIWTILSPVSLVDELERPRIRTVDDGEFALALQSEELDLGVTNRVLVDIGVALDARRADVFCEKPSC